jgi:SAM-dependent methyltransferase
VYTSSMTANPSEDHAQRALSFGRVAEDYDRYRPGLPDAVLEWLLPSDCRIVLDLGAGNGASTGALAGRADRVIAVEPDPRMRALIARHAPTAHVVAGRAEAIPLEDDSVDSVVVCSAWHWMDPDLAVPEVARVLRSGGTFGILWNGLDREGPMMAQIRSVMGEPDTDDERSRSHQPENVWLPDRSHFLPPEIEVVRWTWSTTVDDLVGLLSTRSHVIAMSAEQRDRASRTVRSFLESHYGGGGDQAVALPMACRCWKAVRVQRSPCSARAGVPNRSNEGGRS